MPVKEIFMLKVEDSVIYKTNKTDERISCVLCLGDRGEAECRPPLWVWEEGGIWMALSGKDSFLLHVLFVLKLFSCSSNKRDGLSSKKINGAERMLKNMG